MRTLAVASVTGLPLASYGCAPSVALRVVLVHWTGAGKGHVKMLDSLSKTRAGMRMALGVARVLPRRAAEAAVPFVASRMMADPHSVLSRAVRSNQYVVSGGTLNGAALDEAARENVRAQLRVLVKRILRKYGYPPDKQEKATQTVLEQAEALSEMWAA